ncbi:hypothetical protein RclHR1_00260012 [Rhizophagus clarus]|uniref:Uncharacterized protein n=1 Tax=Rhizophagus clarus TaxID=94130 RepID=A0A2Z6QZW1_9GLOM|nr:hypothetical protein RclHR1_00260012 [Rhizophagus clarus]
MKISFCMELLALYDNANYASYLLNFFPARYKACGVCGSSRPPTFPQNFKLEELHNNMSLQSKNLSILRSQIKKEHTPRFDNIPITEFEVRAIALNSDKVIASVNAEGVMISVNNGRQDEGQALIPMLNILDHFPKQPSEKDIHIIIYLNIQTSQ